MVQFIKLVVVVVVVLVGSWGVYKKLLQLFVEYFH